MQVLVGGGVVGGLLTAGFLARTQITRQQPDWIYVNINDTDATLEASLVEVLPVFEKADRDRTHGLFQSIDEFCRIYTEVNRGCKKPIAIAHCIQRRRDAVQQLEKLTQRVRINNPILIEDIKDSVENIKDCLNSMVHNSMLQLSLNIETE